MKKLISVFLCSILLFLSSYTFNIKAVSETNSCGENLVYTYDENDKVITISGEGKMFNWYNYQAPFYKRAREVRRVIIENGVTTIGKNAFYRCDNLEEVEIPSTVTEICESAFEGCEKIETLRMPNVEVIREKAFLNCHNLKEIIIPSVRYISEAAFKQSSKLQKITISNALNYVGEDALNNNLEKEITYVEDTESIDNLRIDNVTKIKIPKTLKKIKKGIFPYNAELEVLPNSYAEKYAIENNFLYNYSYFDIAIIKLPEKLSYYKTEILDIKGLKVGVTSENGTITLIDNYSVKGYNSNIIGKQTITITYGGYNTEFTVNVVEKSRDFKGHGTEDSPYLICDVNDLKKLNSNSQDKFYALNNDIDLNEEWEPIEVFEGNLDGRGHKISNLATTNNSVNQYFGLFKENIGTIRNLTVDQINIKIYPKLISNMQITGMFIGGVASFNNGLIENCITTGSILINADGTTYYGANIDIYCGGTVGTNDKGYINSCTNKAEIKIEIDNYNSGGSQSYFRHIKQEVYCGGIVGKSVNNYIDYCENYGQLYALTGMGTLSGNVKENANISVYAGGISGFGNANMCCNFGNVKAGLNKPITGTIYTDNKNTSIYVFLGGISGEGYCIDCYNVNNIEYAGGFVCFYNPKGTSSKRYYITVAKVGGICGSDGAATSYNAGVVTVSVIDDQRALLSEMIRCDGIVPYDNRANNCYSYDKDNINDLDTYKGFDFECAWIVDDSGEYKYPKLRCHINKVSDRPSVEEKTDTMIKVTKFEGYIYSIGGEHWQTSNVFSDLSANTHYLIYQKAIDDRMAHTILKSAPLDVITRKTALIAPSTPECETITKDSVVLKYLKGYEYKMNDGEWQKSNVFTGLTEDTEYTFYQRIAETDTTYVSESSALLKVKTDKSYTPGDLDGDEGITDSDVLYLLRHTFRPEKYPVNQPCDYNGDGEITDADAVYLLKHIFRPEKYPLTK